MFIIVAIVVVNWYFVKRHRRCAAASEHDRVIRTVTNGAGRFRATMYSTIRSMRAMMNESSRVVSAEIRFIQLSFRFMLS